MPKALLATLVALVALLVASPAQAQAAPYRNMLGLNFSKLSNPPSAVMSKANGSSTPDLSDQDNQADVETLAAALVYAKTGNTSMRDKVCRNLDRVVGTEGGSRALAVGRGVQAYALAADYVNAPANCSRESSFRSWLSKMRTYGTTSGPSNMIECHEKRPNNWGTDCGASRIAADIYLGDTADLKRAATVFQGWVGDRSAYSGFKYGDLSWQADSSKPVGINPVGAKKSGLNIDGVLPDDQRRGGSCCKLVKENYVYTALQGALVQALLLANQGHDAFGWQSQAVKRAYVWLYDVNKFPAVGDDTWQIPLVNKIYKTSFSGGGDSFGKGMGAGAWLAPGILAGVSPQPQPQPEPEPQPEPQPEPEPEPEPQPVDTDDDGVTDDVDACPAQAGPADNKGCPVAPAGKPVTITPSADTFTDASAPSAVHGSDAMLTVQRDVKHAWLKFPIPADAVAGSATLRLHFTQPDAANGLVVRYSAQCPTSVSGLTYNTEPKGLTGTDSVATLLQGWNEVRLTGTTLAGIKPGQDVCLVVERGAGNKEARDFHSKEDAKLRPQLVVDPTPGAFPVPVVPLPPANLAVTEVKVTLSWSASQDAGSYNQYLDGRKVGSTTSTTGTWTLASGPHTLGVTAVNADGESPVVERQVTAP